MFSPICDDHNSDNNDDDNIITRKVDWGQNRTQGGGDKYYFALPPSFSIIFLDPPIARPFLRATLAIRLVTCNRT